MLISSKKTMLMNKILMLHLVDYALLKKEIHKSHIKDEKKIFRQGLS